MSDSKDPKDSDLNTYYRFVSDVETALDVDDGDWFTDQRLTHNEADKVRCSGNKTDFEYFSELMKLRFEIHPDEGFAAEAYHPRSNFEDDPALEFSSEPDEYSRENLGHFFGLVSDLRQSYLESLADEGSHKY